MQNGWCYVKITNSLLPRHVLQTGFLQIREYEMAKQQPEISNRGAWSK